MALLRFVLGSIVKAIGVEVEVEVRHGLINNRDIDVRVSHGCCSQISNRCDHSGLNEY